MPRPLIADRANVILDAARALILQDGYDATTVERVARRAGIGKGAVYREYAGKAAVLDALLLRSMRALVADVRVQVEHADGPVGLSAAYRFGLRALSSDALMLAFLVGSEDVLGGYVREVPDDRYAERLRWVTDYLTELRRAGAIDPEIPIDTLALVLSSFTIGLLSAGAVLGPIPPERLDAAVELVGTLVERGVECGTTPDDARARAAQLTLLDRLDSQLGHRLEGADS